MSNRERQKKEYIEVEKLFIDFLIWLKKPNPETTLANYWKRKTEAKRQTKEYEQKIAEQAYLLWEADGKPEGKDKYYWKLAIDRIEGKNIPILYRPYYWLEKRILEPTDTWISKQAFFTILGRLGNLALIVAVVTFVFGEKVRRNNEIFNAWQTITSAHGQSGSGGRIQALEFLNSRPLRFPWIGRTERDWFWDEEDRECQEKRLLGFRWKRERLVGLSAPYAYLSKIHLCGADLLRANLQGADLMDTDLQEATLVWANLEGANLRNANLQKANLVYANLQGAALSYADLKKADLGSANLKEVSLWKVNLTPKQIKSTCFWEEAVYTSSRKWNETERKWIVKDEEANRRKIEEIRRDRASDPVKPLYCGYWSEN